MRPSSQERWLDRLCRLYRLMLLAYPSHFRREFSREMVVVFRTQAREVLRTNGGWGLLVYLVRITRDWLYTTFQEHVIMTTRMHALRWCAALPVAILAGGAVLRIAGYFISRQVARSGNFHHVWIWAGIACVLMASAFVTVGVWVVPNRKDSVARIALSVVIAGAVGLMVVGAMSRATTPVFWGSCLLAGDLMAYLAWRYHRPSAVFFES